MTAQKMFELMGFKKNKFDYFGLDRFIYKKQKKKKKKKTIYL